MKIIVGTKNSKKVETVSSIFKEIMKLDVLEVVVHNAASKVPEAPHNHETFEGALNRAMECHQLNDADFSVGLESGLVERYGNMFEEAWAVAISREGTKYIGYSSGLMLPPNVVSRMSNGEKHDEIMASIDKLFDLPDDNRDTWSRYTGGNISRQVSLEEALRNALIQLVPSEHNLYQM